jgi:ParB-like chromosome segregation protein Spo0J
VTEVASMIQHAVPSVTMTDTEDLELRLRSLAENIDRAQERVHALVRERNEVMRELNRDHGVHPKRLGELARLRSVPLAYRIANGEDR